MTIEMIAFEQYFYVVLIIMLSKMVLSLNCVESILQPVVVAIQIEATATVPSDVVVIVLYKKVLTFRSLVAIFMKGTVYSPPSSILISFASPGMPFPLLLNAITLMLYTIPSNRFP